MYFFESNIYGGFLLTVCIGKQFVYAYIPSATLSAYKILLYNIYKPQYVLVYSLHMTNVEASHITLPCRYTNYLKDYRTYRYKKTMTTYAPNFDSSPRFLQEYEVEVYQSWKLRHGHSGHMSRKIIVTVDK